jgi:hypothetical protein
VMKLKEKEGVTSLQKVSHVIKRTIIVALPSEEPIDVTAEPPTLRRKYIPGMLYLHPMGLSHAYVSHESWLNIFTRGYEYLVDYLVQICTFYDPDSD